MAITTGESFKDLLEDMLVRANLSDRAVAYYSFRPVDGQSGFIYNDLLSTGNMFLQTVSEIELSNYGSGYGLTETPNITFTSVDAGTGVTGTGIMQTVNDIGALLQKGLVKAYSFNPTGTLNLITNGNFADLATGWYDNEGQMPNESVYYRFENGSLSVDWGITMIPNSDTFTIAGPCYYWGSFDVVSGSNDAAWFTFSYKDEENDSGISFQTPGTIQISTGEMGKISGTIYYGGYLPSTVSFKPYFVFNGYYSPFVVDNFKFYTGYDIVKERIAGDTEENFYTVPDAMGNYINIYNGKDEAGFGQLITNYMGTIDQTPELKANMSTTWWNSYTLSFWHKYVPSSDWNSDYVEIMTWPNFSLQIRDGYYVLYCSASNTYIQSTVKVQSSTEDIWRNFQISVTPTKIDTISEASDSIDPSSS